MIAGTVEYVQLHQWVGQTLGTPRICSDCGTTQAKKFEWANISGQYKQDSNDWKRVCTSCHRKMENRTGICKKGHLIDETNSYRSKGRRGNTCLKCKNEYNHNYYKRSK